MSVVVYALLYIIIHITRSLLSDVFPKVLISNYKIPLLNSSIWHSIKEASVLIPLYMPKTGSISVIIGTIKNEMVSLLRV
jgi:hypothetical protein